MGIEVIHNKDDSICIRIHLINEIFDSLRPVSCSTVFPYTDVMTAAQGFNKRENTTGSIPYIFGINFFIIARTHSPGFPCFAKQLIGLFVHTDNGAERIIRKFINIKDILHRRYEVRIPYARNAPVVTAVRSKFIFFRVRRMASLLMGSSRIIFI